LGTGQDFEILRTDVRIAGLMIINIIIIISIVIIIVYFSISISLHVYRFDIIGPWDHIAATISIKIKNHKFYLVKENED